MTTPQPFSGWAGPRRPRMLIVGEAWGESEDEIGQPFVGSSGKELFRMLGQASELELALHAEIEGMFNFGKSWVFARDAWLAAADVAFTNVFNLRPQGNKIESLCSPKRVPGPGFDLPPLARGNYLLAEYLPELQRLYAEIDQAQPNLVVAMGNTACWALLQATNIGSIRGAATLAIAEAGSVKTLPTYHPAGVLRNWAWRPIVVTDLQKAFREAQFAELRRPRREVIINPTLPQIIDWVEQTLRGSCPMLSVDIETGQNMITEIGFARSRGEALVVPFVDLTHPSGCYWPTKSAELEAWWSVRALLECSIPKVFQNGMYDLQYILRMGLRPKACEHDTMLLHHSLYPEMLKGLGFLGSIYSDEASWKLMRKRKSNDLGVKRDE